MEGDDELKGEGNSYDFGARMYDSRIGRWMSVDPKFALQPGWSTYKFALDNPLIFVDPEGETEFYYKGKWIGTDGKDNGVIGLVSSRKVKRSIKKHTKNGEFHSGDFSIGNAGFRNSDEMLLVHSDILDEAYNMLDLALSPAGEVGEYANTLRPDGEGGFEPTLPSPRYNVGSDNALPRGGEATVSIHSHPTGLLDKETGEHFTTKASEYSPSEGYGDLKAFEKFGLNIIVGLDGDPEEIFDHDGNSRGYMNTGRTPTMRMYDGTSEMTRLGNGTREAIANGRGKLGEKFEKARERNKASK